MTLLKKNLKLVETSSYVRAVVKIIDLNNDNKLEVLINLNNSFGFGNSGREYIFSKNTDNVYFILTDFAGEALLVDFSNDNFPDIIMAGPGFLFPLLKWNGKSYEVMDDWVTIPNLEENPFSKEAILSKTISFEKFYKKQKLYNHKNNPLKFMSF